jgi:hypothetical protein
VSRTGKRIYYRFRILRHDVAELTVFLGDPQGLAEPGLTLGPGFSQRSSRPRSPPGSLDPYCVFQYTRSRIGNEMCHECAKRRQGCKPCAYIMRDCSAEAYTLHDSCLCCTHHCVFTLYRSESLTRWVGLNPTWVGLGRALGPAGPRLHSALARMGRVVIMIISARGPTGFCISTGRGGKRRVASVTSEK